MRKQIGLVSVFFSVVCGITTGCGWICPAPPLLTSCCQVEVLFDRPGVASPVRERLLQLIDNAREEILLALYSFTEDNLGAAVIRAAARGCIVRVLLDTGAETADGGECCKLVSARIPVEVERTGAFFHHKFAVIDSHWVVTGSWNWSKAAAEVNFENTVILDCSNVAAVYIAEFSSLWADSTHFITPVCP